VTLLDSKGKTLSTFNAQGDENWQMVLLPSLSVPLNALMLVM